jgi:hypothetical protein
MQFQHDWHGNPSRILAVRLAVDLAANFSLPAGFQSIVAGNFWRSLAAVLVGNALYFAFSRFLPPAARHNSAGFDLGLVVDFWFCLVVMGLVELWYWYKKYFRGRR